MKNLIVLLIVPLLFLASCKKTEEQAAEQCSNFSLADSDISNEEEYLIIESIIENRFSEAELIHIAQESYSNSDSVSFAMYFNDQLEFAPEKIDEYISLNSSSFAWGEAFRTPQELISQEELDCLFENNADGWNAYYSKYENAQAILKFGRPIQDSNRAVVTYIYLCGYLCSSGYTVSLVKENNEWIVENHIIVWIS